jgi:hypothetical protein
MRSESMPVELFANLLETLPVWTIPGWKLKMAPKSRPTI